jgi:hypothetical protein
MRQTQARSSQSLTQMVGIFLLSFLWSSSGMLSSLHGGMVFGLGNISIILL